MDIYTVLVCVLAVVFSIVLSLVIILALQLHRRYYNHKKLSLDHNEPFTLQERKSLTKQQLKRLTSQKEELEDNVFDEQELPSTDISQLSLSLYHNRSEDVLVVDIWSVTDAPASFTKGYVEAQLFPSEFEPGQFCTNVRESIDNSVIFNESFGITNVTSEMIPNVYLKLFLYKMLGWNKPKCVGHTVFALSEVPWNPFGKTQFTLKLRHHHVDDTPSPPTINAIEESPFLSPSVGVEKGELYISLRYQQKSGRLNVVVLKAENLHRGNVLQSDSFVKIKLLYQGEVVAKKQTKSQRRNSSPCWNEPFVFVIEEEKDLTNYELIFLVRKRDLLSPYSTIGVVRIGAQVEGAGQSHWYAMMAKGNLMRQVARRHRIT